MSDGIDIRFVRETYQQMPDEELIQIATQDAAGLTAEAQEIVRQEIEKRKLDVNLVKAVDAQNKIYSTEELNEYCDAARNLTCPACGTSETQLNGTMTSEVLSFVIFTTCKRKLKIACPACLDKANDSSMGITLLLGWWGFPWGIIRTIQAIGHNTTSKKTNHLETPNDYLRSFVLSKVGEFEMYKDNKEKLQELISEE